ncbi:glycoside hydrolase family 3 C-terminal domain-containing protein [Microbacterium sp. zg.Y1090]|uniref:glycoside hydrolase family 3 protein n=1 Tax=Microbacterium TaxID=33882 RepID=UPI00214BEB10|nr:MULTISPECIES: glycoside hydrolase family 3 protein [unclassified Microbacterium]MCR2813766.1 glycoside hydrolase family 3 C-terminal domain-containing protein [Microbacterium sp. zg.Y1084]MCR2819720.1 glycoside hydrolase family 3 C-terminal domain-containing protein [Microbacterium sp. zg.Y1090]MDL5487568.1 glycoside hydrolase family 3 N-terminal domain-containing protein [Microbacterium sp. zg-Y1211]WIM28038.1 glycoside hydrolase family 3 N-terminal domain-containing protein [Microbacterium
MTTNPATESGDRSHARPPVESVAQISALLLDTDPSLDPQLAGVARQAAAEGAVLLRNDGVLPLGTERPVAVFGRVQIDWFAVGYGSGGDVKVPYIWNLLAGLRDAGVQVDGEIADVYTAWTSANRPSYDGTWGQWPHHFPEMPLDAGLVTAAASRAGTAVVVIGRAAGEARESVLEPGSFYLTDDERAMLDLVTGAFERTVVVLDAGNVMDLSWLDTYGERIGAVLYAWQGGMEGARAIASLLAGDIAPSGKLTDTIAHTYADYPSAPNFGGLDANVYAEDVFVGYRYFETFAPERVQFPFGFGLGYAAFEVTVVEAGSEGGTVRLAVEVRNTDAVHSGKETVQAYLAAPDGALGKPARALAAFAKTRLLAPGESERLTLEFRLSDLASYDDSGVTGNRSAFVLEPGDYVVHVGTDVRSARPALTVTLDALEVVRQVTEAAAAQTLFPRMTLARDADGTAVVAWEDVPLATVDRRERVLAGLPAEIPATGDRGIVLDDVAAGRASLDEFVAQLSAEELALLARGDVTMHSPLGAPGNAGVLGGVSPSLRAKGVPPVTTTDGPSGLRLSAYASLLPSGTALASTWNTALVAEMAALHGQEMLRKGSDVLLSPGMNIHRDPLCGRNFEYFSEDPLVTGRFGAAIVQGVQSVGVSACPKHFAANNQETNRTRNDSRVSERALREIYLRGFELCVAEAAPRTIMTSYNQVNGVWAHYHYDLVTTILRGEWGYAGCVITDWWMEDAVDPDFPDLADNAYRVRAQVDVLMPGGVKTEAGPADYADDTILESLARPDGITLGELQRGARNVLGLALALRPVIAARADA